MPSNTVFIEGIAIWSEKLPGWNESRAIFLGEAFAPAQAAKRPAPALLPPNERRRAPDTVAIALEVASQACTHAERDPASLPCVFVSTHGDLGIADYMCDTLAATPGLVSPTKFHNSVHNAAAGYWAIATGCMQPYTALSASQYSFGSGLLEALVQIKSDDSELLYVAYDIEAKGALASVVLSRGQLGCALVLNPNSSGNAKMALNWQIKPRDASRGTAAKASYSELVAGNAMASCLPLFEALAQTSGTVDYAISPGLSLKLTLEPLPGNTRRAIT